MAAAGSRLAHFAAWMCIASVVAVRHRDLAATRPKAYDFNSTLAFFDGRFMVLKDLGYVSWHPNCSVAQRPRSSVGDVDVEDMQCGLNVTTTWGLREGRHEAQPLHLVDLDQLRASLPRKLPFGLGEEPVGHPLQFPYTPPFVVAPWAGSQRFNFSEIDFILPGPVLETLATGDFAGKDFTVQRWHGAVMIRRHNDAPQLVDLKSPLSQIERLVTGRRMRDLDVNETTLQHLQVLRIGDFNVLVVSKVGPMDEHGHLAEVMSMSAPNWMKIMFQMLAKGSTSLVWGVVEEAGSQLQLNELGEYELRDIIEWSTTRPERKRLAASLIHVLDSIRGRVSDVSGEHALFHMNDTKFHRLEKSLWTHTPILHVLDDSTRSLMPGLSVQHMLFPF